MKTKRHRILLVLAAAVLLAVLGIVAVGAGAPSYRMMAKQEDWDARIEIALEQYREAPVLCLYPTAGEAPEAFKTLYALGPQAAPYLLERVLESGKDGGDESFLVNAALFNLQIFRWDTLDGHGAKDNPYQNGTPRYHAYNLRAFLKAVPALAREIADSDGTAEEKEERLCELGVAVLPYAAERLQKEDFFAACFSDQLLGLGMEERFEVLKEESPFSRPPYLGGSLTKEEIYAHRKAAARPVDAAAWMRENGDALSVLKEITD